MERTSRHFFAQFLGVVGATAFAVACFAFLSVPYSLGKHPGEPTPEQAQTHPH